MRKNIILEKIAELEPEAIKLMENLVSINSIGPKNDGPGEQEKAMFLKKYMEDCGFPEVTNYPAKDPSVEGGERPNLVTILEGGENERTLWIIAHTDVVPEGDLSKWNTDPFKAEVKDGRIYGRGSEDNQQGLVSALMMARAFIETAIQPDINIGIMLVADEETGSEFGLTYIIENHPELFHKDDIIVIPDAGEPDGSMIEVAEKSIIWIRFQTLGKQVHASVPHLGVNAFRAASNLVVELEKLHELYPARDEVFDPPVSTFEPTKKEANVPNINTIPGEDIFCLDCRVMPEYDINEVMQKIRKMADDIEKKFDVKIEMSTEQYEQAAPATESNAPVVTQLSEAIEEIYHTKAKAMGIGGGTVAAILRRKGLPVAVWATLEDMAHQPNEYCIISNMMNDACVFALLAMNR
jgi:succinyl-diaminopimelate desuccinylase